jgi:hypothetical protein
MLNKYLFIYPDGKTELRDGDVSMPVGPLSDLNRADVVIHVRQAFESIGIRIVKNRHNFKLNFSNPTED